uniref:Uncharacterized protein n=1 Tax=Rhizobium leguminosarum TaxID=384 RepID=A0A179BUB9_RHILE|nr:hypothetical protein A4U53_19910 [Rhizobium leguminosarum]
MRRALFERRQVGAVHGEDQIEIPKVPRPYAAGALSRYVDAVAFRGGDRTPVRRLAFMPAASAGGIYRKIAAQACLGDEMAKNSLRKRRTAYIAHANEEDADAFHR